MDPDPLSCIFNLLAALTQAAQPLITLNQPNAASIIAALVALLCLFVSAFASGCEIAYFSIKPDDYEKIANEHTRETIKRLLSFPEKLLATILITNNLVNVTIVILCSFVINEVIIIHSAVLDFIFQTILLTFLILLFGEILPKLYSSNNNLRIATKTASSLSLLSHVLNPVSKLMVKSTYIVNKMVTRHPDDISMEDLSQALELSDVQSSDEKDMLEGILKFGETTVSEIMRPRIDVVDIDYHSDFDEVVKTTIDNGYSRMPVYEDNSDNIKGILYAKDLLPYMGKKGKDFEWQKLLRPAYFVPETRMIDDLLEDFRKMKIHMAVIVDEFGCTQGIATLEDVLEEIVGDIDDEYDTEEKSYTRLTDDTYIFDGKTLLNDFYKITGVDEEEFGEVTEDAETIAGLLLNLKGDFPHEKEPIEYGRFHFLVMNVAKHRIVNVRVKIMPKDCETDETNK